MANITVYIILMVAVFLVQPQMAAKAAQGFTFISTKLLNSNYYS